jgi:Mrp family chromosome partitioning ATPase
VILLDLPPLNECAQALQVAQGAEGIVMVVQTERTRAEVARTLKNELDRLGVRILGAVLNRRKFYIPKSIYKHL